MTEPYQPSEHIPADALFQIDLTARRIHFWKDLLQQTSLAERTFAQAIRLFPGKVYFEVWPFMFATKLMCCKDGDEDPKFIQSCQLDDDDGELRNLYQMDDIRHTHSGLAIDFTL